MPAFCSVHTSEYDIGLGHCADSSWRCDVGSDNFNVGAKTPCARSLVPRPRLWYVKSRATGRDFAPPRCLRVWPKNWLSDQKLDAAPESLGQARLRIRSFDLWRLQSAYIFRRKQPCKRMCPEEISDQCLLFTSYRQPCGMQRLSQDLRESPSLSLSMICE